MLNATIIWASHLETCHHIGTTNIKTCEENISHIHQINTYIHT